MKLHASVYTSPLENEDTFRDVYIEDSGFSIRRQESYFSVEFEMYWFKKGRKIVLGRSILGFQGMNEDIDSNKPTTNRTMVISIPNEEYDAQVAAIPLEIQTPDGQGGSVLIPNPEYDAQVAAIEERVNVPMLQYLRTHEGNMPVDYQMVDWGYPTYEDAVAYFQGGTLSDPEIDVINPLMEGWILNNVSMKGAIIGDEFEFVPVI
jgi:hypothetical protein